MTNATLIRALSAATAGAVLATTLSAQAAITVRPASGARPNATTTIYYTYGGTLAATQWRTWFSADVTGCYAATGTGAAQNAFTTGALKQTLSGTGDCSYNASTGYPRDDFSAGDAPLTTAQVQTYNNNFLATKGPAIVLPVAGAALSEAFNSASLPANLEINVTDLCNIWKGTTTNWTAVTNQATGKPVTTSSLPIKLITRLDGSGSTFIHTAHLNGVCSGGYNYVGTAFPTTEGNQSVANGGIIPETGSGGVATEVANQAGAIGYVAPNSLIAGEASAGLLNRSGQYETPTSTAITAAFTSARDTTPPPGYPASGGSQVDLYLTNPAASGSYSEVGFTYTFLNTCYPVPTTTQPSAAFIMNLFDNEVYKTGTITQTGLVPIGATANETAQIALIKPGSLYNARQGCH